MTTVKKVEKLDNIIKGKKYFLAPDGRPILVKSLKKIIDLGLDKDHMTIAWFLADLKHMNILDQRDVLDALVLLGRKGKGNPYTKALYLLDSYFDKKMFTRKELLDFKEEGVKFAKKYKKTMWTPKKSA